MSHAITPATSLETAPRGEVTPGEWERVRRYALFAATGGAAAFVLFGLLH